MNKKVIFLGLVSALSLCLHVDNSLLYAQQDTNLASTDKQEQAAVEKENKQLPKVAKPLEKTINFTYDNEELVDIINYLAAQKGVNVVLPQGANAISVKVTLSIDEKLTIEKAWNLLITMLDIAGYTMMPRLDMYVIVKTSPAITKEPLPLYIGISPDRLPDTDKRIRYLYYLSNIKANDAEDSEIPSILKNLLPQGTSSYKIDTNTNGIIIVAKSNDIRAAMKIILELDKTDFQENLLVLSLRHALAGPVASLFNEKILKSTSDANPYRLDAKQRTEASFFSKHIRIIPNERTNSLVLLGRPQAIERMREFIYKYVDIELDAGKSVLHVYQLQYLDAAKLEPVLKRIIESSREGGTGQATVTGGVVGGTQRSFDEVIIKADTPVTDDSKYFGGNKLIIACRSDDWKIIEKLIQDLDTPQPQVLLEVLVADLTVDDERIIASILRNPAGLNLGGADFQAGNADLSPGIILNSNVNTTSINADLLRPDAFPQPSGPPQSAAFELTVPPSQTTVGGAPGSTIVSLNDADGRTWSVLQFLQSLDSTKILSHPHVLATNNEKATVLIGQERLLPDEAAGAGGTTTTIKFKKVNATLQIDIIPRISSASTVGMQVIIADSDFIGVSTTNPSRTIRNVTTNALVRSGDVLALGGLVRVATSQDVQETPLLSKIPIIGYFFKARDNSNVKTNLSVFISPTIIQPRLRSGVSQYTKDYIKLANEYSYEGTLFDSLRDPITRWFFTSDQEPVDVIDNFLTKDEFKSNLIIDNHPGIQKADSEKPQPPPAVVKGKTHYGQQRKPKGKSTQTQKDELKKIIADDDTNPLLNV